MREARQALDTGKPHQALAVARRLAKASRRDPSALNACAWIAHEAGDGRAAARFLEHSLAADPLQVEALSNLATLYHAEGRHDAAIALLDRALARVAVDDAATASLHYNRGNALKSLGRLDDAESAFRAAVARRPETPAFHGNLANTLVALGRLEDAVAAYRQSLAQRPDHAETLRHLAATLAPAAPVRRGRGGRARAPGVRAWPGREPSRARRPAARPRRFRGGGARPKRFVVPVALSPGAAEIHLDLGALLLRDSGLSAALSCFEIAAALKPGDLGRRTA
ncbi:MAG: tetratricopeptide repeat protein [Pseudomonadota bacterium]